jgi:cysteine desulfurase
MRVYLDNAATTPVDPKVVEAMIPVLTNTYGNPSSIHAKGREAKALIERSRKSIAKYFNASPAEFFFTSGGTEADNMIIRCAVHDLGVTRIITSAIEHHAVLHTAEELSKIEGVQFVLVNLDEEGSVDLNHLKELLADESQKTLVSLMHGNNEIANLLPLETVGEMCKAHNALFHSDTVQTMCHYRLDFKKLNVHFATCAAHKFHGPKGVGFMYVDSNFKFNPMITGGAQERNVRAGTENIHGIVGLAKAIEIAHAEMEHHQEYVTDLKLYMVEQLKAIIPGVAFNGKSATKDSLYTVLSVCFPPNDMGEMFLYNLDIEGICASGGSACSSGSNVGSHVLRAIGAVMERPSIRFSFSRFSTKEEIDHVVGVLKELYAVEA